MENNYFGEYCTETQEPQDEENTYKTKKEAWKAFDLWLKRKQGHYSANFGIIPLKNVKKHSKIVKL